MSPTYETLQQISRREFSAEVYYYEMITTSADPRLNHLSYANRKIIAKMFAEVFLTGDITKYDQTKPVGRLFNRQLTFDDIPLIEKDNQL